MADYMADCMTDRMNTPKTPDISILLVDDHPVVRQGYRRVLENQGDFRVIAEADSATSAYGAFKAHAPDVVVLDISMKGASGLEAIRNIRARNSRARILVFSMHSEAAIVKAAFNAGAGGYVTKSSEPAMLIRAIRAVARGERAMSDDIAHVLATESLDPSQSMLDRLAEREIEILRQLAAGATTEQIATNLNLSLKTVQNYHYMVKAKTGLQTDAQLVRLAVACGLTSL
jgi:two-component system, NarL family, invasion response regulator UvrY